MISKETIADATGPVTVKCKSMLPPPSFDLAAAAPDGGLGGG